MPTIHDLFQDLEPDTIIQKTQLKHDVLRGNYKIGNPTVKTHPEFQQRITDYFIYHYQGFFGGPPMYVELALHNATEILNRSYQGGYNKAVMCSINGEQGGLILVFDTISNALKQQTQQAYFNFIVSKYIDFFDWNSALKYASELHVFLKPYLPNSFSLLPPEAIVHELKSHIWTYISTVRSFGNLKKRY